jgi:tetratricopeptide (TPR) repeat protein
MRNTLFILLITLLMAGCSQKQPANGVFSEVEYYADHHPDRANLMLDSLERCHAINDTLLYQLVKAEALHGVGVPLSGETDLEHCIGYFKEQGDHDHQARAMLHQGMDLYSKGHYIEGLGLVKEVEREFSDLDDSGLRYLLYAVLGDINDNAADFRQALHYYHQALEVATQEGDVNWQVQMLNNLATTFDKNEQTDSLQYYVEQSKQWRNQTQNVIRATSLVNEASMMKRRGKLQMAKQLITASRQFAQLDKGTVLLADIEAEQGNIQQAHDLWYELLHSPNPDIRIHCYERLIDYYQQEGFYERVADLSQRLNQYYQHAYVESPAADIIALQTQLNQQQKERRQYHVTIVLLSCISILLSAILIGVWYYRRRINRLHTHIDALNQKYLTWQIAEHLLSADTVSRLHQMAARGKEAAEGDWQELHTLVQQQSPAFLARLNGAVSLSPLETNICLLIRLRFTPSEIATLAAISPQRVTNMRTALLLKIFSEKGGARDFDARLRGM